MANNLDVLLVSEEKIKAYTNINTNVSPAELQPYIFDAQNILLPNYLGATYYMALKERVSNGTLTAADEYLLDQYIGPMLCNWGFLYSSTFIQFRTYNKGILKGTSENGETIELDELKFLQSQIRNIAEGYTQQMVYYLVQNSTDYPLYNSPNSLDGQLPDKNNAYTVNTVIPHYPYAINQRALRGRLNGGGGYMGTYPGIDCYNLPGSK